MHFNEAEKQKLAALLSEAKSRYSRSALERLEDAFAIVTGSKQHVAPEDPSQEGTDFFLPGLTAKPWHDPGDFPIIAKLEQAWEAIRDELKYALDNRRGFQHYVRRGDDRQNDQNSEVPKEWKALYLKEHREKFPDNRAMCPETVRIIDEEPRVENYVIFSALDPGGHIKPHHATYNWTFNVHLGLIVPDNCALRVKDEARRWEEGKCLVFDGSFEHEAWNRGDFTRFILLIAIYHPDLTDIEISLLKQANLNLATDADVVHENVVKSRGKELEDKRWWV